MFAALDGESLPFPRFPFALFHAPIASSSLDTMVSISSRGDGPARQVRKDPVLGAALHIGQRRRRGGHSTDQPRSRESRRAAR